MIIHHCSKKVQCLFMEAKFFACIHLYWHMEILQTDPTMSVSYLLFAGVNPWLSTDTALLESRQKTVEFLVSNVNMGNIVAMHWGQMRNDILEKRCKS